MRKMYVGNIPYNATEEDLRELFSEYGEIESLKIMQDQFTNRSKGFGFIEMVNEEDAKKAIATLNGKDFKGKSLTVAEARPQQKRQGFNKGSNKRSSGYGGAGGTGKGWR
jgi:RNA recognition motif-containing protein